MVPKSEFGVLNPRGTPNADIIAVFPPKNVQFVLSQLLGSCVIVLTDHVFGFQHG